MRANRLLIEAVLGATVMMTASPLADALRKEGGPLALAAWGRPPGGSAGLGDLALQQVLTLEPSTLAILGLVITVVALRLLRKTLGV